MVVRHPVIMRKDTNACRYQPTAIRVANLRACPAPRGGISTRPALDQRLRDLGERKEWLSAAEHDELLALVSFTQQRSLEKLEAEAALQDLQTACTELAQTP
jgi:hypothetical protein